MTFTRTLRSLLVLPGTLLLCQQAMAAELTDLQWQSGPETETLSLTLDGPVELYDLSRDPAERNDVAAQHPDEVRRIEALFESSRVDSAEFPMAPRS